MKALTGILSMLIAAVFIVSYINPGKYNIHDILRKEYPEGPAVNNTDGHVKTSGNEDVRRKEGKESAGREYPYFFWIVVLICLSSIILIEIRKNMIYRLELKGEDDPDEIISRKKPFYTNRKRWNYIRRKAIEEKMEQAVCNNQMDGLSVFNCSD